MDPPFVRFLSIRFIYIHRIACITVRRGFQAIAILTTSFSLNHNHIACDLGSRLTGKEA
jgi:hypothetical protein